MTKSTETERARPVQMDRAKEITETIERTLQNDTPKETPEQELPLSEDLSSGYLNTKYIKPYWRGRLHLIAFYATIAIYIIMMYYMKINKVYMTIYFISQLILYGVSSTYHLTEWKTRNAERFFRKLDHSSIFLLISGTQTCVVMSINQIYQVTRTTFLSIIPITYGIALVGIVKVFLFATVPRYINVLYYIAHGVSAGLCIPLEFIIKEYIIGLLCILGGIMYITGATIYGIKRPNPSPKLFGYHEIFHSFTIAGNLCFLFSIIWANYKLCLISR
ncbi:hemolysin III [Nematocida sp. AWRm80]|nr:hemolysin III [Nematocida sp. AWRm80]